MYLVPGYPVVNSPLQIRFYVCLTADGNTSVTLNRTVLTNVVPSFVQNISDTFGVQLAGKQ